MILVTIALFAIIILFDLPFIIKQRKWKLLVIYTLISVIALIYTLQLVVDSAVFSFLEAAKDFAGTTLGLNYDNWT